MNRCRYLLAPFVGISLLPNATQRRFVQSFSSCSNRVFFQIRNFLQEADCQFASDITIAIVKLKPTIFCKRIFIAVCIYRLVMMVKELSKKFTPHVQTVTVCVDVILTNCWYITSYRSCILFAAILIYNVYDLAWAHFNSERICSNIYIIVLLSHKTSVFVFRHSPNKGYEPHACNHNVWSKLAMRYVEIAFICLLSYLSLK